MRILSLIIAVSMSVCSITTHASTVTDKEVADFKRAVDLAATAVRNENYEGAIEHLEAASKLGDKVSQYTLALLYMEGKGVEQDYAQAYIWLNVAAEAREKEWRNMRDRLKNALSEEQIIALAPHVNEHIAKYGADAQNILCFERSSAGTRFTSMRCSKDVITDFK